MRAKPVSQKRSQAKRDRILNAMDLLLERHPFAEIGVLDLARKAGVSPATIYQRFSNVDVTASVLLELYFIKVEAWATRPRRSAAEGNTRLLDALTAVAADAYDQVAELGHIMRPAYLYSRHRPERLGPEWTRLEKVAVKGFKAFLQGHVAEIRVDDLDRAATLLCYLFNFFLLGPLLHADDAHWQVLRSRKAFSSSLATIAFRYLTADSPPR